MSKNNSSKKNGVADVLFCFLFLLLLVCFLEVCLFLFYLLLMLIKPNSEMPC